MSECFKAAFFSKGDEDSSKKADNNRKIAAGVMSLFPLAAGAVEIMGCCGQSLPPEVALVLSALSIGFPLLYLAMERDTPKTSEPGATCPIPYITMAVLGGAMLLCSNFNMLADGKAPIVMISLAMLTALAGTWATVDRDPLATVNPGPSGLSRLSQDSTFEP